MNTDHECPCTEIVRFVASHLGRTSSRFQNLSSKNMVLNHSAKLKEIRKYCTIFCPFSHILATPYANKCWLGAGQWFIWLVPGLCFMLHMGIQWEYNTSTILLHKRQFITTRKYFLSLHLIHSINLWQITLKLHGENHVKSHRYHEYKSHDIVNAHWFFPISCHLRYVIKQFPAYLKAGQFAPKTYCPPGSLHALGVAIDWFPYKYLNCAKCYIFE